jgi:hypothetical protein
VPSERTDTSPVEALPVAIRYLEQLIPVSPVSLEPQLARGSRPNSSGGRSLPLVSVVDSPLSVRAGPSEASSPLADSHEYLSEQMPIRKAEEPPAKTARSDPVLPTGGTPVSGEVQSVTGGTPGPGGKVEAPPSPSSSAASPQESPWATTYAQPLEGSAVPPTSGPPDG